MKTKLTFIVSPVTKHYRVTCNNESLHGNCYSYVTGYMLQANQGASNA